MSALADIIGYDHLDKVKATIDPKKRPGMAREIDEAIAKLKSAAK